MKDLDIADVFEEHLKKKEALDEVLLEINKPKTTKKTLDIFAVLGQSDKQNYDFYDTWSEQAIKEFSPWVIQRWLANKKLGLVNEITNPLISVVPKKLAWRLFCVISSKKTIRYRWDTPPKKITGNGAVVTLVANHYDVSTRVAKTYMSNLSKENLLDILEMANLEKAEVAKLKKVIK